MDTPPKKNSNDNSEKEKGFYYQALVAIKYGLENDFEKLIIEHKGDVTFDNKIQIEVKHHIDKKSLADASPEFWNTLYNWVKNNGKSYEQLILHTRLAFS